MARPPGEYPIGSYGAGCCARTACVVAVPVTTTGPVTTFGMSVA